MVFCKNETNLRYFAVSLNNFFSITLYVENGLFVSSRKNLLFFVVGSIVNMRDDCIFTILVRKDIGCVTNKSNENTLWFMCS